MRRVLKGLVLALVLIAFVGFSYEQIGRWRHRLAAWLGCSTANRFLRRFYVPAMSAALHP